MGFHTCGPDEVIVVSGCCYDQPLTLAGGRVYVWPTQKIQKLSLNIMTLEVLSQNVYTKLGPSLSATGVAQIKFQSKNPELLNSALEMFLGKSREDITRICLETVEGHQRAIMGLMTIEEIYQDRKKFAKKVTEVASADLLHMGVIIVSYTIKNLRDSNGYLEALGLQRIAEVDRDAKIGEAENERDAGMKTAVANQEMMSKKYINDILIEEAKRDFKLKKAAYDMEVETKKAESEMAYQLQVAKSKQAIKEADMRIKVEERAKAIEVQEQEVLRKVKEMEAQVHKPADAEKFRLETIAEANRAKVVLEAEAKAEAIRVKGEAEAYSIEAKAAAEANQMMKKADAWKDYEQAAMVDMLLGKLPQIAAEVAQPLMNTKKITVVASGKGDIGASKLTGEVLNVVEKIPGLVEKLTGVSVSKSLNQI